MNANATKPGWKTSEFWLVAISQLLPFLVALGVIPMADANSVSASVASVVAGVQALASLITYAVQRYNLKTQPGPVPQIQPSRNAALHLPGDYDVGNSDADS